MPLSFRSVRLRICRGLRIEHSLQSIFVRFPMYSKIVNEYDQEIPQSQTADNPVAP